MKNKLIVATLTVIVVLSFILSGCNTQPLMIVYLGDSIAEAIAGMSPLSERQRYGYYSIIGIRNEYEFRNRAVSGHQTGDLLRIINQEDTDARMTRTLLKDADIIHISILGNDLLLNDIGRLILDIANDDYSLLNSVLDNARNNFSDIVGVLREYNPDAVIMFQKVYNPVFEVTTLIRPAVQEELALKGIEPSEYRELAGDVLDMLNGIIDDYLEDNPGAYYIIDAQAEFDRIYQEDTERGRALIFCDDIHPSNEGHAVIADLIQAKLEELNLADKKLAVNNYKKIRKEQLKRMFNDSVDVKAISRQIDDARSCGEITEIYFNAIEGKTPDYC
ncbi:MAG: SGNH/GDSL hydrolase family protein [Christensenellales bacterium]|jgi:lysophospholipase L1-like esterase